MRSFDAQYAAAHTICDEGTIVKKTEYLQIAILFLGTIFLAVSFTVIFK